MGVTIYHNPKCTNQSEEEKPGAQTALGRCGTTGHIVASCKIRPARNGRCLHDVLGAHRCSGAGALQGSIGSRVANGDSGGPELVAVGGKHEWRLEPELIQ